MSLEVKLHKGHLRDMEHQIQKTQYQIFQLNKKKYRELAKGERITPEQTERHKEILENKLQAVK